MNRKITTVVKIAARREPQKKNTLQKNTLENEVAASNESVNEVCILCNKMTNIPKTLEIEYRSFYIEGAGQLCCDCYHSLYQERHRP